MGGVSSYAVIVKGSMYVLRKEANKNELNNLEAVYYLEKEILYVAHI